MKEGSASTAATVHLSLNSSLFFLFSFLPLPIFPSLLLFCSPTSSRSAMNTRNRRRSGSYLPCAAVLPPSPLSPLFLCSSLPLSAPHHPIPPPPPPFSHHHLPTSTGTRRRWPISLSLTLSESPTSLSPFFLSAAIVGNRERDRLGLRLLCLFILKGGSFGRRKKKSWSLVRKFWCPNHIITPYGMSLWPKLPNTS